jgi:Family of unknown function (DUF6364)
MTHLTFTLEEEVLEKARSKAHQQGTSVDELLRSYLLSYVADRPTGRQQSLMTLLDLSSRARSGSGGRRWTRDELHER